MYESYVYLWRQIKPASERYAQCEGPSVGPIERPEDSRYVSSGCVSPQLIILLCQINYTQYTILPSVWCFLPSCFLCLHSVVLYSYGIP
jgi:hypothetical protein